MKTTSRTTTPMPIDKPLGPSLDSSSLMSHEQAETVAESDVDYNPKSKGFMGFKIPGKSRKRKEGKHDKAQSSSSLNRFLNGGRAKQVKLSDVSTSDAVVAVMGPTGAGKSSFINVATGHDLEVVGHSLQSCTSDINVVKLSFPELSNSDICFVDTPGFDDTYRSDVDVFKMISEWLNETYQRDIKLSGLLYFHRISDNRMAGTPLKNLRLFEKLCGEDFKNIVLVTTMWDEVDQDTGANRESELKKMYWNGLISRGSRVARFERDRKSAFSVLQPFIDDLNTRDALLLQTEVTELGLKLRQTTAGKALHLELENLVSKHQEMLSRIRDELKHENVDEDQLKILMEEYQNVAEKLRLVTEDVEQMKMQLGEHLKRTARRVLNWSRLNTFFQFFRKPKDNQRQTLNLEDRTKDPPSVKHELPQISAQSSLKVPEHLRSGYGPDSQDRDAYALQDKEDDVFHDAPSSPTTTDAAAVANPAIPTDSGAASSPPGQDVIAITDSRGKHPASTTSQPTSSDDTALQSSNQTPISSSADSDKVLHDHDPLPMVGKATETTQSPSERLSVSLAPVVASVLKTPRFLDRRVRDSTPSYHRTAQGPVNSTENQTQQLTDGLPSR